MRNRSIVTDVSQSSACAKRSSNRTLAHAWTSSTSPTRKRARSRSWMAMSRNEPPAVSRNSSGGGWTVAGVGAELLDPAELARVDELLRALVARVEAAHEPDLDRDPGLAPQLDDARGLGDVLGDRLLGPDRLAGPQRRLDERGVGAGRRDDDDRVDGRVVDRLERVGRRALGTGELAARRRGVARPGPRRPRRGRWGWPRCCGGGSGPSGRHRGRRRRSRSGPSAAKVTAGRVAGARGCARTGRAPRARCPGR